MPPNATKAALQLLAALINEISAFPDKPAVQRMAAAWAWKPLPPEQLELLNAKEGYAGKWSEVPMFIGTDGTNEVISLCFDGFSHSALSDALAELGLSTQSPKRSAHAIAQELTVYELFHGTERLGLLVLSKGTAGPTRGMATLGYMSEECATREGLLTEGVDASAAALKLFGELLAELPRCKANEGPAERIAAREGWIAVDDPMTHNTFALERDGHRFVVGDNNSAELFTLTVLKGYDCEKMQAELRAQYQIIAGREKRVARGTLMILRLADNAGFVSLTQVSELSTMGGGTISFVAHEAGLAAGVWETQD